MYCTRCGTQNPDDGMYCTNCSARLVKPGESSGQFDQPPSGGGSAQQPFASGSAQPPAKSAEPYPGFQSSWSGQPGYTPYPSSYASQGPIQQGSASGRAVASMILSIVSVFTCGPLLSIPGLILGKMELNAIRQGQAPAAGETFAKIGFYLGIAATALSCLVGIVWLLIASMGAIANVG